MSHFPDRKVVHVSQSQQHEWVTDRFAVWLAGGSRSYSWTPHHGACYAGDHTACKCGHWSGWVFDSCHSTFTGQMFISDIICWCCCCYVETDMWYDKERGIEINGCNQGHVHVGVNVRCASTCMSNVNSVHILCWLAGKLIVEWIQREQTM